MAYLTQQLKARAWSHLRILTTAFLASFFLVQPSHSEIIYEGSLTDEAAAAEIVVSGIVNSVRYEDDLNSGLPYTIVTLYPSAVLTKEGEVNIGSAFEIKQFGGYTTSSSGETRHISVSVNPKYRVGDDIIALLQGNGEMAGPYVSGYYGVIKFSEDGAIKFGDNSPVRHMTQEGRLTSGTARNFQDQLSIIFTEDLSVIANNYKNSDNLPSRTDIVQLLKDGLKNSGYLDVFTTPLPNYQH